MDKIQKELKELGETLQNSLEGINKGSGEFHENMMEVLTKHPEMRELVKFIVAARDNQNTNQIILVDTMDRIMSEMLKTNIRLIDRLKDAKFDIMTYMMGMLNWRVMLFSAMVVLISVLYVVKPELAKAMMAIIGG